MTVQHLLWLNEHGLSYHFSGWAWGWRLELTWPGHGRFVITDDLEGSLRRVCGLVTLSAMIAPCRQDAGDASARRS